MGNLRRCLHQSFEATDYLSLTTVSNPITIAATTIEASVTTTINTSAQWKQRHMLNNHQM
jgi:hypothetical protein